MADLTGLRVLVVEDEGAVALLIESMLEELGCHVTASVATLAKAQSAARADHLISLSSTSISTASLFFPLPRFLKVGSCLLSSARDTAAWECQRHSRSATF